MTWVQSQDAESWLNLATVDSIIILSPGGPGGRFLIVAERVDRPNTVLHSVTTLGDAQDWIRTTLGAHDGA